MVPEINISNTMVSRIEILIILLILIWQIPQIHGQDIEKPEKPPIQFALNNDPVVEYDVTGGFRLAQPNPAKSKPRLQIYKDGTVHCNFNAPQYRDVKSRIEPEQLRALLAKLVNQNDFYRFDSERLKEKIERANSLRIADAGTSEFRVNLRRGKHECKVYALFLVGKRLPNIPEVKTLYEFEQELHQIIRIATLGGQQKMAELLKVVNENLARKDKTFPPFKARDFTSAIHHKDGRIEGSLQSQASISDQVTKVAYASIVQSPEQEPVVDISIREVRPGKRR